MPFIRAISLAAPGTDPEHVIAVQVSDLTTSRLRTVPVEEVHTAIRRGARYRVFNERTGTQADVEAHVAFGGRPHVITVEAGVQTDDLLRLPRF